MGITASGQLPFLRPSRTPTSKSNANQSSSPAGHHPVLSMLEHHRPPAFMPLRERDAAVSALVLHVLETRDQVRNAAETADYT